MGCGVRWFAHRKHALDAGLSEQVIEAIRKGKTPNFGDAEERTVFDIAVAIYRDRRLADALYARGVEVLGEGRLIDLIGVLGYYALISMTINAFAVMPPVGAPLAFGHSQGT